MVGLGGAFGTTSAPVPKTAPKGGGVRHPFGRPFGETLRPFSGLFFGRLFGAAFSTLQGGAGTDLGGIWPPFGCFFGDFWGSLGPMPASTILLLFIVLGPFPQRTRPVVPFTDYPFFVNLVLP